MWNAPQLDGFSGPWTTPEPYLQLGVDAQVHAIHLRVLRHIGAQAEVEVKAGVAASKSGG